MFLIAQNGTLNRTQKRSKKSPWQTTQQEMNEYFGNEGKVPGFKQRKRKERFLEPRLYGLEEESTNNGYQHILI